MRQLILKSMRWLFNNGYAVMLIGYGFYLMCSEQYKLGGVYLLFFGLILIQRTKIKELEERILRLENNKKGVENNE